MNKLIITICLIIVSGCGERKTYKHTIVVADYTWYSTDSISESNGCVGFICKESNRTYEEGRYLKICGNYVIK